MNVRGSGCTCVKGTDKGKQVEQVLGVLREVINSPWAYPKRAGKMGNRHEAEEPDLSGQLGHQLHDFGQVLTSSSVE